VEFTVGVFSAVASAIVFIGVLWFIGGELAIPIGNAVLRIPGFLVIAAFIYAVLASGSMIMIVQVAFNWLVDNYPRLADWTASACRLASLLVSLDRLERAEREETMGRIVRQSAE